MHQELIRPTGFVIKFLFEILSSGSFQKTGRINDFFCSMIKKYTLDKTAVEIIFFPINIKLMYVFGKKQLYL